METNHPTLRSWLKQRRYYAREKGSKVKRIPEVNIFSLGAIVDPDLDLRFILAILIVLDLASRPNLAPAGS